jgi:molecular chaperone IbpA
MTHLTQFDMNRLTPYAVGFDRMFNNLQRYAEHQKQSTGFPPYNIRKENETDFFIEMAVAGLTKEDVEVEYKQGEVTVRSTYDKLDDTGEMIHRGISMKKFDRKFTLADDIIVKNAELANGMLTIQLERIIPDAKKPRLIDIK